MADSETPPGFDTHPGPEDELRLLHELTTRIVQAETLETGLEAALKEICQATGWLLGEAWLVNEDEGVLELRAAWRPEAVNVEPWLEATQMLRLAKGEGLPGEAWATQETAWVESIGASDALPRAASARDAELHAGVAIPITTDGQAQGVLMFILDEPRDADHRFVQLVSTIGTQLGATLARRRAQAELAQRARELEQSNKDLRRFAEIAAHDLQEPLRDIARYVQRLGDRYQDVVDEDGQASIEYAVAGAKRLHQLLNALLRYAEAGEHPVEGDERADGDQAVARALSALQEKIDATGAHIEHGSLPEAPVRQRELQELLTELIDNALTFHGDAPPLVRIDARRVRDGWLLTVEDEGIGIDPAYQELVFELFERLDREGPPGMGVGLPICRRIVERHGGSIQIASEPGEGTTVAVRLPDEA